MRKEHDIEATFKSVDTCAAEFEAYTPYYYSTYETEDETRSSTKKKAMILGGGPNRIGQEIEFDYCCCQASFALRDQGYESIMVNCNPETVSTDYDTSDKLYFEPLTVEDVLAIHEKEKPQGVIVRFGGQTPPPRPLPQPKVLCCLSAGTRRSQEPSGIPCGYIVSQAEEVLVCYEEVAGIVGKDEMRNIPLLRGLILSHKF